MRRWVWFSLCAALGLALMLCGLLVPAHLRAVDSIVLAKAGRKSPTLIDVAWSEGRADRPGTARLLYETAKQGRLQGTEPLFAALVALKREHPDWEVWGGRPPGVPLDPKIVMVSPENRAAVGAFEIPIAEILIPEGNRTRALGVLSLSKKVAVQQLLHTRALTNTVLFPPSGSSSGQAFDAAVALAGLLLDGAQMNGGLSNSVFSLAFDANHGANPQRFEQMLMDFMTLGQRLSWSQMAATAGRLDNAETLRLVANFARSEPAGSPVLVSAVLMASEPGALTGYLLKFSKTGRGDVSAAMAYGRGGLDYLLAKQNRFYRASYGPPSFLAPVEDAFAEWTWSTPGVAFGLKWFLYLAGGFLLALSAHVLVQWRAFRNEAAANAQARPMAYRGVRRDAAEPSAVRPVTSLRLTPNLHLAREGLFSIGFLVVMLLLTEPFMAQEVQSTQVPFRLRLPTVGSLISGPTANVNSSFMNTLSLLTLLLFFVIQALIYVACLVKLAEIRRQRVPARVRLRLLENEDHLFDAGLYLGFVGTIISLIMVSLGVIKPSLMAAYSSTSFGIIFVSFFKIFHLRPLRRKLLLESENMGPEATTAMGVQTSVTPS